MWYVVLAAILAGLVLLSAALTRRWGRASYEKTFQKPENEIQTTTPWKVL